MKNLILTSTFILIAGIFSSAAHAEWAVDLSRRTQHMRKQEMVPNYDRGDRVERAGDVEDRAPASVRTFEGEEPKTELSFVERILDPGEPSQDIVILNTDRGFVPNTIRVRKDGRYTVHVVNVNEKEKNVSFILDGFSEHHATFFGKVKTFKLEPKKEGVYSFLSPETAVEGRFIVFSGGPAEAKVRLPSTAQVSGEQ